MYLNGQDFTRRQIEALAGNMAQLGGTRHYTLDDGRGRGMRAIDVDTGPGGLRFTLLPDRGLDISLASYQGVNLSFITPTGETHPAFYDPKGIGWLRTFAGGLLTTCGLTWLGPPVNDAGEDLGLHGRYSTLPAARLADNSGWHDDEYVIEIEAEMEEAVLFGNRLRLTRTIRTEIGSRVISLDDEVYNYGHAPSPLTVLYHCNLGWPLLSADSRLVISSNESHPRDAEAEKGVGHEREFSKPIPGFAEQVFRHDMQADNNGFAHTMLVNPSIKDGLALLIKSNTESLPYVSQWKMPGAGDYVLGIEPCNVPCEDRVTLRENNRLPMLEAGENRSFELEISVIDGNGAIEKTEQDIVRIL